MKRNDLLILAAGRGSRMGSATKNIPKICLKVNGKTILENQLEIYKKFNLREISIVTGYLNHKLEFIDFTKIYNPYWYKTNMLFSLYCARDLLRKNGSLIVVYSDIIFNENVFKKIYLSNFDTAIIQDANWKNLWEKRFVNIFEDAESLILDNDLQQVLEIGKKTGTIRNIQGQYIGITKIGPIMKKKILQIFKKFINSNLSFVSNKKIENCYMTDLLQYMIEKKEKINFETIHGGWFEFDTMQDLKTFKQNYK